MVEVFGGPRVFRVVDEQGNIQFVHGPMRAQPRKTFSLGIEFSKHSVLVTQHHQIRRTLSMAIGT